MAKLLEMAIERERQRERENDFMIFYGDSLLSAIIMRTRNFWSKRMADKYRPEGPEVLYHRLRGRPKL